MPEPQTDAHPGLFSQVVDWIATRARATAEMARLSSGDLGEMARDLGMAESDLRGVLSKGANNTQLMDAMMQARGLDPAAIAHLSSGVLRDLEVTCTRCGAVAQCRRELAAGTAAMHCHDFCGNADTFDALQEGRPASTQAA